MYKKQLLKLLLCPIFLLISAWAMAQGVSVSGKVTDEKGEPLPGATVSVKGTTKGTNADANGKYNITANHGDVLVFSMVGFVRQEVKVAGAATVNITLVETPQSLNEVVVIGYGTQKRKDITGSVASVKGDSFKDQPISDPISALQGRIAGVNVVENSSQPGATPSITIRGLESLSQPAPLYIVDGVRIPDITNLNVQDIASIDVLKDAAAAAIYGSAAAGGVLLITTKKGVIGQEPTINFSARYGVTKPKLVQLLGRDDYVKLQDIVNPSFFGGKTQTDTLPNQNWVDAIYKNATEQNYNLSVVGASDKVNYLFSAYDNNNVGSFIKNSSNIVGLRANADYKLSKYITIGEEIGLSQRKTDPVLVDLHNAPFRSQPIIPEFNPGGFYGSDPQGYSVQFSGPNPFGVVNTETAQDYVNNVQANVYADIKLPFHLDFRSTWGYTYNVYTRDYFQDSYSFGAVALGNNTLYRNYLEYNQLLGNYVLSWNQSFGKHSISALAGFEQITGTNNSLYTSMGSIALNGYTYVPSSASGGQTALSGIYDPNYLVKSEFARLNYNYADRYYLSASIRQDANFTEFGSGKVRGVFPGASAGWNISNEEFYKPFLGVINSLKLRGSYGSLGNSNFAQYQYSANYAQNQLSSGISGGSQGFGLPPTPFQIGNTLTKLANPNLHWETVIETNIGLDGEALNGRLYFTLEWYNKKTKDMIYPLPLPTSTGFTQPYYANVGTVNNRGFDISAGYRDKIGKLGYDIGVTAGFNKNKVLSLSGTATGILYDGYNYYNNGDNAFNIMSNQNLTITKAGQPFGEFYGYKVIGIFPTDAAAAHQKVNGNVAHAGDLEYQDVNGDGVIDQNDRQVIGNPNPSLIYGINIHLNYQGFDLAMLFNGVQGVQLFNGVKAYEESLFADGNSTSKVFGDSFLGGNGLTSQPRLGVPTNGGFTLDPNQNYSSVNSYFVENGSYLKLKNLQLGYTFSSNILQKLSIRKARVFVMANNVFTITKYTGLDPELGSSFTPSGYGAVTAQGVDAVTNYPQAKIYSAGLDLTF